MPALVSTPSTAAPAQALLTALGPASAPARSLITRLYQRIEAGHASIDAALKNWEQAMRRLPGDSLGRLEKIEPGGSAPFRNYGLDSTVRSRSFLFAVHTYFVLVAKLVAAEVITRAETQRTPSTPSFLAMLSTGSFDRMFRELCRLEDGRLFRDAGIELPDGGAPTSLFGWYLDAFDQTFAAWMACLARALDEVLNAVQADPSPARDILKDLYQALVPKRFRAALGEFYTPDWLADLVLDEVGYDGDPESRLLDPACGSGTFLVQALSRIASPERGRNDASVPAHVERLTQALTTMAGLDLNPVAVEAARANVLLHLWPVLSRLPRPLRIPVYGADAISLPREHQDLYGHVYRWESPEGQLDLPFAAVQGGWLRELLQVAGQFAAEQTPFPGDRFLESVKARIGPDRMAEAGDEAVRRCGAQWSRLSRAAPALDPEIVLRDCSSRRLHKFDLVVGNPPWIRWRAIGTRYRQATLPLWREYGLFPLTGLSTILGAGEKDFSMLFTYRCADLYLKSGGRLGFLITMEALRSKGAGQGFRRFRLGANGDFLKVQRVHDLVAMAPFTGISNKTALLVLERGSRTTFPVPFIQWAPRGPGHVGSGQTLEEVRRHTEQLHRYARPLSGGADAPWRVVDDQSDTSASSSPDPASGIEGQGAYRAYRGASTEPYGVYRVRLKPTRSSSRRATTVLVENLPEQGKRKVPKLPAIKIESALVYPAVRGSDIRRWHAASEICVVMPHDPLLRKGYSEQWLRDSFPKTYAYLLRFKDVLRSRGSQALQALAKKSSFYAMYGIGPYTLSPQKVIWQRQANDLHAAVVGPISRAGLGSKPVIPTDTTAMIPASTAQEAHYLCGMLNAATVRAYLRSFTAAGRGFGTPSILQHVRIPRFDRRNPRHVRIAELSQRAHRLAQRAHRVAKRADGLAKRRHRRTEGQPLAELTRTEKQLDTAVRAVFNRRRAT